MKKTANRQESPKKSGGKRDVARQGSSVSGASVNRRKEKRDESANEDFLYLEPIKRIIKPDNQLELTQKELAEEVTRVLTANNPNTPNNTSKYSFKDRTYKIDPPATGDHLAIHFSLNGCSLFKDTEDAEGQVRYEHDRSEERDRERRMASESTDSLHGSRMSSILLSSTGVSSYESEYMVIPDSGKNQFNFSERAAQTFNCPIRERGVSTQPPPVASFSATLTQWEIYDSYRDEAMKMALEEDMLKAAEKKKLSKQASTDASVATANLISLTATASEGTAIQAKTSGDVVHSEQMSRVLKKLERIINQNSEDEIYQDYRFWEDESDSFRPGGEGSLLPLWRLSTERTRKKHVTSIAWNPRYNDLIAVGYGSYDFSHQVSSGLICCYSLKNTSHPEFMYFTESGVMCLHFNAMHPSLLAVGLYDGNVLVYDLRDLASRKPIYSSSVRTGKHTDPVWQVQWQPEEGMSLGRDLNFFSISSDGHVANWILSKNELKMEIVMQLKLTGEVGNGSTSNQTGEPEEACLAGLASGCCFDFSRCAEHLFLIGTEEGKIHKCSKAYSGSYLDTFEGHSLAVYAVKWNPGSNSGSRIFASCSADWTVKLWDATSSSLLTSFDLGNSVGDVAWLPTTAAESSTVLLCVCSDGTVCVWDLAQNKHEPLCHQKVVKRAKLTRICTGGDYDNSQASILVVGDDRGGVTALKLSPNLRKEREVQQDQLFKAFNLS